MTEGGTEHVHQAALRPQLAGPGRVRRDAETRGEVGGLAPLHEDQAQNLLIGHRQAVEGALHVEPADVGLLGRCLDDLHVERTDVVSGGGPVLGAHDVSRNPCRECRQRRGFPETAAPKLEQERDHRILGEVVGQVWPPRPGKAEGPHAGPEPTGQFGLGLGSPARIRATRAASSETGMGSARAVIVGRVVVQNSATPLAQRMRRGN